MYTDAQGGNITLLLRTRLKRLWMYFCTGAWPNCKCMTLSTSMCWEVAVTP